MHASLARTLVGVGLALVLQAGARPRPVVTSLPQTEADFVPVAYVADPQRIEYSDQTLRRVYRVTAYCDRGLTASGVPAGEGQCAAPADIPFGSKIYIPALGRTFIVTDRTARRFRTNTVDIFMPGRQQCLSFGRKYLECVITLPRQTPRYGSPALRAAVASMQP